MSYSLNLHLFLHHFAAQSLSEVQYLIIESCLLRGDRITALKLMNDWNVLRECSVSKYFPGTHFYALDRKFDTLELAKQYLLEQGYIYKGLYYHYIPLSPE